MSSQLNRSRITVSLLIATLAVIAGWGIVLAAAPVPNPLPKALGVDVTVNGPAASIHGSPLNGRALFVSNCVSCHGDRGTQGAVNPGATQGVVPALNPINLAYLRDTRGDPAAFARALDLFLQHGSLPNGNEALLNMPAFGDHDLLTQQQLADIEAYVMQLNNVYWLDRWYPPAEVRMTANRNGNQIVYSITVVNQGGAPLDDLLVKDTLPPGLAFVQSDFYGLGNNPAQVVGSTVQWVAGPVPTGGTLGPFLITVALTGSTVPANVSQVDFSYTNYAGNIVPASAVSGSVIPGQ